MVALLTTLVCSRFCLISNAGLLFYFPAVHLCCWIGHGKGIIPVTHYHTATW